MLARRPVTRETVNSILRLRVKPEQEHLVATNATTLAQAAYEPGSYVWALWDGDRPIGLIAMLHPHEASAFGKYDDRDAAYLWRLMIAADEQGKGYGKVAIDECLSQSRDWGLPRLSLTAVDDHRSSIGFYEAMGFRRTGRVVEGEVEFIRDV